MRYKNILLIDDDHDDHELFFSAIKEVSPHVDYVGMHDATDALKKLLKAEVSPDVIFLDLNMPVMHGQEFLREIKKNDVLKSIPVIIFSTSSHESTIQRTKELGAFDFITKPGKFSDLVKLLRYFLSSGNKKNGLLSE